MKQGGGSMLRILSGAIFMLVIGANPVSAACQGDELFSDDFSDPQLSKDQWPSVEAISIGNGYLQIKPKPQYRNFVPIPGGDKEFDLCVDITYPQAKQPDGGTFGGAVFWFKDWKNHYYVWTTPVGVVGATRVTNEKERVMGKKQPSENGLKTGAGAKNSFQVTVKGNMATVYGNDKRLFAFRTVAKDAEDIVIAVGLLASSEQDQENAWRFSNVKLTEPPK
jgi:hypothetical protein